MEKTYLQPNENMDYAHEAVQAFVQKHTDIASSPTDNIVRLYYAVRDGFVYNPYQISLDTAHYQASYLVQRTSGHCIDKAIIFGACARAIGVPSRLHFARVRNHIGTEKLEEMLGTNVLVFHGYVSVFLENKWVKATPAFNKALCDKLNVEPMDFDGKTDSVFQQYAREGNKFMEYLHDYGPFPALPYELMIAEWRKYYPKLFRG